MLSDDNVESVDQFSEKLRDRLKAISRSREWGIEFEFTRPPGSDYYRSQIMITGQKKRKNWLMLNGHTYHHPSYSSPIPWKIQARFPSTPGPLWQKKEPQYQYNRNPHEWSLAGADVYCVGYETLYEALLNQKEEDLMEEILDDLRLSCSYSNGQQPPSVPQSPEDSDDSWQPPGTVSITIDVDTELWNEFSEIYTSKYRSRKHRPKRSSYADLRFWAVYHALSDYIDNPKYRQP